MGFMYQHISVERRAQIGLQVVAQRGTYGLVTGLAREMNTSRKFIYGLGERVEAAITKALAPRKPGPKPLQQAVVVDEGHLQRSIVTLALVGHASERGIADCLDQICLVKPSLGYINKVLARASKTATELVDSLPLSIREAQVAADELFAQNKAHLVAVDHHSLLVLALRQVEHCDAPGWQDTLTSLLERGLDLKRLASDGGKALATAMAQLPDIEHHLDLWHASRHISAAKKALEGSAYKAIGKEWELEKKAKKMDASRLMGGYIWQRYDEARAEAERKICQYEQLCTLGVWAREALEAVERLEGRIRPRQECLAELRVVSELMRTLEADGAKKLADYLDKAGPSLLGYADRLLDLMPALVEELGEEGTRLLCREWRLAGEVRKARGALKNEWRLVYERAHLLALLYWGKGYRDARSKVVAMLEGTMRGSSLAECVNSWLRPYAELMKGLGERFLPLFLLYRNSHIFQRGKRAGFSPLQLAGIATPSGDWLDWLGLGQQPQCRQSVRWLPKAS
jgi:hypothetical protein